MKKIGLIYGSDTGATEGVSQELNKMLSNDFEVEMMDMYKVKKEDFERFEYLVLGLSTWYDGELQSDWDSFFEDFCQIDFSGKTVALYGLGDQYGYGENFVDGIGILAVEIEKSGGKIIGKWANEDYDFEESKALLEDENVFYGLALDEDNQSELTSERLTNWVSQINEELSV
jgi:flavodoxin I